MEAQRRARRAVEQVCGAGAVLEYRGDGSLVGFRSAGDALGAAWCLRTAVEDEDFRLRISVTLEQPPAEEVLSAGMHERTQSFEARCPPGSIVTDGRVRRAMRGHHGIGFEAIDDEAHTLTSHADDSLDRSAIAIRAILFSETTSETAGAAIVAADISQRCIVEHRGTIVDANQVQHVATFRSCTDALAAAHAMHAEAASRSSRTDEPDEIVFRIAASVGEVVHAEENSFGVAVVEAARLTSVADAGSTIVSSDVADLAGLELDAVNHREPVALKGLDDPVSHVRLEHPGTAPPLLDLPHPLQTQPTQQMVGRHDELSFALDCHDAAGDGTPITVVVSGEEGIGKTRLVCELARRAHADGTTVLYGACEPDPRAPYAPLVDALARAAHLDAAIDRAVRDGTGPLGSLLGGTRPERVDRSVPTQLELFGAVSDTIQRLCVVRPVLLVLDDAQWGSNDTIRLLVDLLGTLHASRLTVALTQRSDMPVKSEALTELLTGVHHRGRCHHLPLQRLGEADVVGLIESRTSEVFARSANDLGAAISKITGGNPLYAEEFLTHLIDTHVLHDEAGTGWSLAVDVAELSPPDSIVDLVSRRIARLGDDSCHLLGVAALMGTTFDLEVLSRVTTQDLGRVLDTVDDAIVARLIRPADDGGVRAFSDEIVRAAFLRHVRPSRIALIHEQLANAIEELRPGQLDELIVHWSEAIGQHARDKVVLYLRLATERDLAAAAWESVVERSRALLDLADPDDLDLLCETRLVLGTALRLLGEDTYRPELTAAADLARSARDPVRLFHAAAAMMRPGQWTPESGVVDAEIVGMCEDVLLLVDDPDDPIRIRALAALATALADDSDQQRRSDLVSEAQARARRSNDLGLLGSALVAELLSGHRPDTFERRRTVADELRRIGRATGDRDLLFTGTFFSMLDSIERGATSTAQTHLEELRAIATAKRDFFSRYRVAYLDALLAVARCEPTAPERIEAAHLMAEGEPVDSFAPLVLQNATLAMYNGTLADILTPIAEASDMWDESWSRRWDFALAKAYLDIGNHDLAAQTIRNNPEPTVDSYWLASYCQLAEVGRVLGLSEVCDRVIEKLTPFRGRFVLIGSGLAVSGSASAALGQAHLGCGDHATAEVLFRESIDLADAAVFPYFAAHSRRLLAETLLSMDPGDPEADQLLHDVLDDARHHGFRNEELRAEQLLSGRIQGR